MITDPPAPSRPTIRTIADRAGVSYQTVSNVLNFPERVRPATRERVLEAIRELNYRPNAAARSLAMSTTRLVALRVGDGRQNEASILDPFMRELARIGGERGYRLVLDYSPEDDAAQIASFEELHARQAVDGVVIPQTHVGDQRPAWLLEHGLPFVAFGRPWGDMAAVHSWVDVDVSLGIRMAAEHLRDLGHTRIAFLGAPLDGGLEDTRLAGWRDVVEGLVAPDDLARLHRFVDQSCPAEAVTELVRSAAPTALITRDDSYAVEASHALERLGLRVGRDVAVVGFDDSELARRASPPLSSVAQPVSEVAELIWESLIDQLEGRPNPPLHRIVPPRLVVRASSDGVRPGAEPV
jgi:DNA-binding LacI/PurR family transcriptional regulator